MKVPEYLLDVKGTIHNGDVVQVEDEQDVTLREFLAEDITHMNEGLYPFHSFVKLELASEYTETEVDDCPTDDEPEPPTPTDPPTITGADDVTIEYGSAFNPNEGVTATDSTGAEIPFTVSGMVDTDTVGEYELTYTATDSEGNTTTITRKVTVSAPTTAPVFSGLSDKTIDAGDPFDPEDGVTCKDASGKEIPFTVTGEVGSCPGTYDLTYKATDEWGNSAEETITISVTGVPPTFSGVGNVTITQGAEFDPRAGVVVKDASGNVLWFAVSPDTIDTCEVGETVVSYAVLDDCGQDTIVRRTVTVTKASDPVISGADDITVTSIYDFDPMEGVTATDAHGNELTVTMGKPHTVWAEVEYIEGHGQEYIDTGLKLKNNSRIVADMQYTYPADTKNGYRFTGDETNASAMFRFGTYSNKYWLPKYGNTSKQITPPTGGALLDRVTIDMDANVFKINGEAAHTFEQATSDWETGGNCYIFAINAASIIDLAVAKLYSYKLYDEGTLQLDLIPYIKDDQAGLYDKLTGNFYGNVGSGAFTAYNAQQGEYTLEYTATDSCGNETKVTRTLTLVEVPKPVISGADDVTIAQGTDIDLKDGVTATDANGREIDYTVSPETINPCAVGDTKVTYTATDERGNTTTMERTITITKVSDPVISGTEDVTVASGEDFDPLKDVTAVDAKGNELTVTVSEPQNRRNEYSYIKSHGQEYIDTGIKLTNNSRIVADVQFTLPDRRYQYSFTGDMTTQQAWFSFATQAATYRAWYGDRSAGPRPTSGSITDRATIDMDNNVFKVNGTTLAEIQSTVGEFETGGNCHIFAINGTTYNKAVAKLYSYKLYDGDTLLLDLIPYEQNGELGLQDKLTGTFYGNQGEGTFTGGGGAEKYELTYTATDECGNETTVTRTVTISEPEYKTYVVLDQSGDTTLFVNATEDDIDRAYATAEVLATYPALGYGHNYEFSSADDVLWKEYREQINIVDAANEIQPTKMDYWFYGMSLFFDPFALDDILALSNCTSMVSTFEGANISGSSLGVMWDVSHVTNMQRMFYGCAIDQSATALINWNVSNATNMREMFCGCPAVELGLDNWNTSNVTDFTDMFSQMANLEAIYAGENFTIGDFVGDMFTGDTNLVGGAGTAYIDGSSVYARIDTEETPGYFTAGE